MDPTEQIGWWHIFKLKKNSRRDNVQNVNAYNYEELPPQAKVAKVK
jgi:hypothetical protein